MKVFPWLKMRKKTERELPYEPPMWFGPKSNGEFFVPQTERDRKIRKLVLERAAEHANRLGMDRRQFLASAMGMATTLLVINEATGCSSAVSAGGGAGGAGGGGGGATGGSDAGYCVPYQAQFDPTCANAALAGKEFIFDVQTHWFEKADLANFSAYQNAFGALFNVATEDAYINNMFCNSDTTMTCLTAWPGVTCTGTRKLNCGFPLSNTHMVESRDKINALAGGSQRVVNHTQILPQDPSGIDVQLAIMEEYHCKFGVGAWKLYPGFKPGFRFDDESADKVVQKGLSLGVKRFCVHKGLPIGNFFDPVTNYPDDIGPIATKYPEAQFIIYHSAICAGTDPCSSVEGPYDAISARPTGTDALIRSVLDHGIKPGGNVYGETGTAFNNIKSKPDQAAHFFGKLLKYLGEDNVVWGTDCIINGNPQPQIEAFRTLTIPQAMQDQFGYPALTDAIKAKIFGLNSAKLYGVDVAAARCRVDQCPLTALKGEMDEELGPRRWAFEPPKGPQTFGEFWEGAEEMRKLGRPG
jgi:predicted TIM-barrel fold metal-dependent hydrolase